MNVEKNLREKIIFLLDYSKKLGVLSQNLDLNYLEQIQHSSK